MNGSFPKSSEKFFLMFAAAWALYGACAELYNVAWGTGVWLGQFSPKWALAFFLFTLFCIACFIGIGVFLWTPQKLERVVRRLSALRDRLGLVRWIFAILSIAMPIYVLQYTFWGIVLHGPNLRIVLASFSTLALGFFLTKDSDRPLNWSSLLAALALIFGVSAFFAPLALVTDYPFSLGWSEGNRLWDYSIMFGSRLYDYPEGKSIPVYLDKGRQFIGGIPFLLNGITIWQERLWLALINVIPYLILGWVAYRPMKKDILPWILAGIWAFTFVGQGPIHPPLLLCAIVVAFAWGRPLWLAVPLIAAAGYFAQVSRTTWLFAPGMWAVMLEMGGAPALDKGVWRRAIILGIAGVLGGYIAPFLVPEIVGWIKAMGAGSTVSEIGGGVTLSGVSESISDQPLLWYRLLPNETYKYGILGGLILTVAPLVIILIHLLRTRRWALNAWQKLAIVLPLLAFLVVGLIVSAKIGGGGDLHNLDMFIIGLAFTGALAWRNGGRQWIDSLNAMPAWIRIILALLIAFPGYRALRGLKPIAVAGDIRAIALLADITPEYPSANPLPDILPSEEDVLEDLNGIRAEVERAAPLGEILFMDQRQLLTFGYVTGVPLVPEYDKKVLIDKALSGDAQYFEGFYRDLASRRFSLIISHPLHEIIKTDPAGFGEENNDWVKWVSTPILCYYQPLYTLRKTTVQILAPRRDTSGCAQRLP